MIVFSDVMSCQRRENTLAHKQVERITINEELGPSEKGFVLHYTIVNLYQLRVFN